MKNLEGSQIGKYKIDSLLGDGGMGSVYRATDSSLNRQVAIKIIRPAMLKDPQFKLRFLQEAQAAAKLNHPSIITIYEFNEDDGRLYMVMELVLDGSLLTLQEEWQQQGQPPPLDETLHLLAQVAEALGFAHRQGVIHRDIKPDNIMRKKLVRPERPGEPAWRAIVTDFGLAKLQSGGLLETDVSMLLGTLPYIAPEQFHGQKPDGRSDLYGLGIVLYEMTTGQLPFKTHTITDAIQQHCYTAPRSPRLLRSDIPEELEQIILKALEKEPADRFQDGYEMAQAIRQVIAALPNHMMTQMESLPEAAPVIVAANHPAQEPPADQLSITDEKGVAQTQPMMQPVLTVGRSSGNDITLKERSVSSRHARLEHSSTGWKVIDVGSTNGTYLDTRKLEVNVSYSWPPGEELHIGPYTLVWQTAVSAQPETYQPALAVVEPLRPAQPAPAPPSAMASGISDNTPYLGNIRLEPATVRLAPGARTTVKAHMTNESSRVDHFTVEVTGLPAEWVVFQEKRVELMPDRETTFQFTVQPPAGRSLARTYPYRLTLRSTSDTRVEGLAFGNVLVEPAPDFAVRLNPSRLQNSGNCQVVVSNTGNIEEQYAITGLDDEGQIIFDQMTRRVTVPAGHEGKVTFALGSVTRPFTGHSNKSHPFAFQVAPTTGKPQKESGQLAVSPRFPRWLITLILLIAVGSAFMPVFSFNTARQKIIAAARETATAVAMDETATRVMNATATTELATTTAFEAAATGTRSWEISDLDGDGLTNEEEINLGTNPEKADTDRDGLLDGDEINADKVKRYGTDPINPDTDNDGLLDGAEVNGNPNASGAARGQYTDPSRADTDGDGEPDAVDPDSGQWPTPTPLPEENLLTNPSFELPPIPFEDANTNEPHQELRVPAGWHLLVYDKAPVDDNEGVYVFPEMIEREKSVLNECNGVGGAASAELCDLFDKGKILKVFKGPGLPIRFALYQEVFLSPGAYSFTVTYFANSIWYEGRFSPFEDGRAEVQLCISGAEYSHEDWQPVETGKIVTQEIRFIVPESQNVTLFAKFRNRFVQEENGWFFDHWTLQKIAAIEDVEAGKLPSAHGCDDEILQPGVYNN